MSAHLCLIAWNDPIGRPNCTRTFAYSTDISSTFCAPPIISLESATAAWSSSLENAAKPSWVLPSGDATTLSNSSFACLRVVSIVCSGVRVRPSASPATVKNMMPSVPVVPAARATTTIVSAVKPSITNIFSPDSLNSPPTFSDASIVMPAASHLPEGSVNASAAIVSPDAMPGSNACFSASVPAARIAPAASTTEEKYGAHSSTRPISSSTMPSSMKVKPWPPYSSGMARPWSISSWPICFHTAGSKPSVVSIRRRTSVSGDLDSKNCRTARRSSSCSSEKAKFTLLLLLAGLAWKAQHALTDDVVLDLARTGVDGLGPARHEDSGELVELVGAGFVLLHEERVGTDHVQCGLTELS